MQYQDEQERVSVAERAQPDIDIEPVAEQQIAPRQERAIRQTVEPRPAPPALQQKPVIERVIVEMSPQFDQLFAAFAKAQGEFGSVAKTLEARVQSKKGEGSSYTYEFETLADVLETVRKPLAQNGLFVSQFPYSGERTFTVRTLLGHSSGQFMYSDLVSSFSLSSDVQSLGSVITYLRRYALKAILGLAAASEDDDGQAAVRSQQRPERVAPAPRRSEQQRPAPEPAATSEPAPPAALKPIGRIAKVEPRGDARMVVLANGFRASTNSPDIIKAVETMESMKATVELRCRPSSNPAKYAPVIEEIVPVRREAAE